MSLHINIKLTMEKIGIEEIHNRLKNIAFIFDQICKRNSINYYMLGGTMLGAVRHKGFIPWDDEMDFGVQSRDYERLISILESELPEPYKCCTYKNNKAVQYPFLKIIDSDTLINDPRVNLPLEKQLGVNIDVFPLYHCKKNSLHIKLIRMLCRLTTIIYVESTLNDKLKRNVKKVIRSLFPISHKRLLMLQDYIGTNITNGPYIGNVYGRWKEREVIPSEWYGENVAYKFENIELNGFKEYDKYLSQLYGNYMALPPENERFIHVDNVYTKDSSV